MAMEWSNLAAVVTKRTYARKDNGPLENWTDICDRSIAGNTRIVNVSEQERQRLRHFMYERKSTPAGRGLWFSGSPAHHRIGGVALNNCWFLLADDWQNYVIAQDLLMLGGGVGMSVESEFVRSLPRIKKGVVIVHKATKDADFIVPDRREGWCELLRRTLEAFFVTGKGFTYSTVCLRGAGETIKGFGGTASGPLPLIAMVEKICALLIAREGKKVRPIDAGDILCAIAEMVVAGNVRRSALILIGDPWDKEFLKAKRWDLGTLPSYRSAANFSVVCDSVEDLHPSFWKTYEIGEPFGIINRKNIQQFARMGTRKPDTAVGVNPCGEANLEDGEPCNLLENALCNMNDADEFEEGARLMFRYGKRVTMESYHHEKSGEVIARNRRVGVGITGCLSSPLFVPAVLDRVYDAIEQEDIAYSKELGIPLSIRRTTVKPSGTMSKVMDTRGEEGIHPAYSRYMIQRVRFAASDPLVPLLRDAGHHVEPVIRLDGTLDYGTVVVDFYLEAPAGAPVADEDWDTWKQLEVLKMVQRHWSDQSVSVTVYYKKDEIPKLKQWLAENLDEIKTISFLCHDDHGFQQAPKEAISKEQYERLSSRVKPIDVTGIGDGGELDGTECLGGSCPIR
jgi:ribonucleoside-triphosphate reductase (thioredoxin)